MRPKPVRATPEFFVRIRPEALKASGANEKGRDNHRGLGLFALDNVLLEKLDSMGVQRGFVTLHVGAGTFQLVRAERVEDHKMHAEYIEVSESLCKQVQDTRANGGRVIAVGTTAVRSLETAAANGSLEPFSGDSRIFIYPGYEFRAVDGMITNFHLPESTLLMLVSAFAGEEPIRAAYRHAVEQKYRFFSYGDAMLLM